MLVSHQPYRATRATVNPPKISCKVSLAPNSRRSSNQSYSWANKKLNKIASHKITRPKCPSCKSKNQLAHTFCKANVSMGTNVKSHTMARPLSQILQSSSNQKTFRSRLKDTRSNRVCSISQVNATLVKDARIRMILRFRRMKRIWWLLRRRWCRIIRLWNLRVKRCTSQMTANNLSRRRQCWISFIPRLWLVRIRISKHISSHSIQINQCQLTPRNGPTQLK